MQCYEQKVEQDVQQKLTWAQVVEREVNYLKNNVRVPPHSSLSVSSRQPQKVKGKGNSPSSAKKNSKLILNCSYTQVINHH